MGRIFALAASAPWLKLCGGAAWKELKKPVSTPGLRTAGREPRKSLTVKFNERLAHSFFPACRDRDGFCPRPRKAPRRGLARVRFPGGGESEARCRPARARFGKDEPA